MTTKTKEAYAAMLLAIEAYEDAIAEEYANSPVSYEISYETGKKLGIDGEVTVIDGFESFEAAKKALEKRTAEFVSRPEENLRGIEEEFDDGIHANYTFSFCRQAWIRPIKAESIKSAHIEDWCGRYLRDA